MDIRDLTGVERDALLALLAHAAEADDTIDAGEMLELDALGEDLGIDDLQAEVMRARARAQTMDDVLELAATVTRPDARELIRTILLDLAQADGERSAEELALVEALARVWA